MSIRRRRVAVTATLQVTRHRPRVRRLAHHMQLQKLLQIPPQDQAN